MTDYLDTAEACVDLAIARVGKKLVLGAPLGLGKPVQLVNAFYRRACQDPSIELQIITALSLELPTPGNHIEASLSGPIVERLFGDYEPLDYMVALRRGDVPSNITLTELYFKAGSMKGVASAQQNYISSNYTHIARDMVDCGINVLVQLVAARETDQGLSLSLSCNPDTAADVIALLKRTRPDSFISIAQVHDDLPFMENDAEVPPETVDVVLRNPQYMKTLFAVPNAAVPVADYATAIHASSLIPDGGTLQIGIGALGDAVAHACILRHEHSATYRAIVSDLTRQPCGLVEDGRPFERGLYVSTEMFVNGMMHLMEHGIVKRKVYDDLALQRALNAGDIGEQVDARMYDWAGQSGLMPQVLDAASLARLQYWGLLPGDLRLDNAALRLGSRNLANDMSDADTRNALLGALEGCSLRHGRVLHGGFFLGPRDFYRKLAALDAEGQERICMTSVLRTNQLLQDYELYCAQRQNARFINTGMIVSLSGAVASDALEDGTVISGVGGQYNFVAMAHDLPGARSVLCIRSTRGSGKHCQSNIVPFYGHTTIPRHLRDVIVTEYGVADLRGQCDAEIIKRLLNIADSRFQDELLEWARHQGKLEQSYRIPDSARRNTPAELERVLGPHRRSGLLPDYPFGTELTDQEIALAASLRKIKALSEEPAHFVPQVFRALLHHPDEAAAHPFLARVQLEHPETTRDFLVQQLLLLELEQRGLLKAG